MKMLINSEMIDCFIMDKVTRPDGVGGVITDYQEGAKIKAAFVKDDSIEARIADKQGVKDLYKITTRKSVVLRYHDIVKQAESGRYFLVTSNGDDKATPAISTLDIRQVTAEEWEMK